MSIISMGFQNGLSSYVFPAAQCDLKFSSFELGILNMAFMIGGIASCFLWGALADNLGRKRILFLTHLLDAVITIICSVLPSATNLLVCRFLNGFLIGEHTEGPHLSVFNLKIFYRGSRKYNIYVRSRISTSKISNTCCVLLWCFFHYFLVDPTPPSVLYSTSSKCDLSVG